MTPKLGDTVHVLVDPKHNNGSDTAPAIITRVFNESTINLRVLHDGPSDAPEGRSDWHTSVHLYPSRAELDAHHGSLKANYPHRFDGSTPFFGAFWPDPE